MSQVYKIAIVGSGTAGLAAAIFLTRNGQDVSVFERFNEPRPLGAEYCFNPPAWPVLPVWISMNKRFPAAPHTNFYGEDVKTTADLLLFRGIIQRHPTQEYTRT